MLVGGWFLPGGICLCWVWWGQWPLAPTCFVPPPLAASGRTRRGAVSPKCWWYHLPLLSEAGWENWLAIFCLCLPQTKKWQMPKKWNKQSVLKAKQNIAILQHPWQSPRLPDQNPSLGMLRAAAQSSPLRREWGFAYLRWGAGQGEQVTLHTGKLWHSWE